MYLLDTSACIRVLNNTSASLVSRLRAEDPGSIRLSSVTKAELLYQARRSTQVTATARAHDLILVSHNNREFSRVAGLQIKDWE